MTWDNAHGLMSAHRDMTPEMRTDNRPVVDAAGRDSGIDTALPNAHENLTDGATFIDGSDGRRGLVERELRSYDWV